jgi:hypothetical protein
MLLVGLVMMVVLLVLLMLLYAVVVMVLFLQANLLHLAGGDVMDAGDADSGARLRRERQRKKNGAERQSSGADH